MKIEDTQLSLTFNIQKVVFSYKDVSCGLFFFFFFAILHDLWKLSSPTRD